MILKQVYNNILPYLVKQLETGEQTTPFLFLDKNLELCNSKIHNIATNLLKHFDIPNNYLYILEDNTENLKIKEVRDFVQFSHTTPPYKYQIFFIQNISRFTLGSSNSLLKFLEEPGHGNIIFLTNRGENGILETILSRVKTIYIQGTNTYQSSYKKDNFYTNLLHEFLSNNNTELTDYFFRNKEEKQDYIKFLDNIILYAKENLIFIDMLEEIQEDIIAIKQNNLNPRYVVDKWILKLKENPQKSHREKNNLFC